MGAPVAPVETAHGGGAPVAPAPGPGRTDMPGAHSPLQAPARIIHATRARHAPDARACAWDPPRVRAVARGGAEASEAPARTPMATVAMPPQPPPQPRLPHEAFAALWPDSRAAAAAPPSASSSASTSASSASSSASSASPSGAGGPLRRTGALKLIRTDFWMKHRNAQVAQRQTVAKHRKQEADAREAAAREEARSKQDARDQRVTTDDAFSEKCRRDKPQPVMQLSEHRIKAILANKDPATGQPKQKSAAEKLIDAANAAQILAKISYPTLAISVPNSTSKAVCLQITAENRQEQMMRALAVPGAREQLAKARAEYARQAARRRKHAPPALPAPLAPLAR